MYKLKSITQVVDVLNALQVTSPKAEHVIGDIQRMHLKHVNKKDFSPIVYKLNVNDTPLKIIVKFKNNDFYDTTCFVDYPEDINLPDIKSVKMK